MERAKEDADVHTEALQREKAAVEAAHRERDAAKESLLELHEEVEDSIEQLQDAAIQNQGLKEHIEVQEQHVNSLLEKLREKVKGDREQTEAMQHQQRDLDDARAQLDAALKSNAQSERDASLARSQAKRITGESEKLKAGYKAAKKRLKDIESELEDKVQECDILKEMVHAARIAGRRKGKSKGKGLSKARSHGDADEDALIPSPGTLRRHGRPISRQSSPELPFLPTPRLPEINRHMGGGHFEGDWE